ncbi:hydantoinase/oxoprolinase family protein [Desulfosporosinus metallidurans]|uniref:N-methylhydantoinase A n=1 Tax=Desulfosporosinus metallidurans TaxID=1888891 RepID=A0A1Q8QGZ9_9FIRM|nr:hydantoinase/oxoprolinase family protein [Desulfosporosinus metallidurans]OLN26614.1 N-methylhydantoinase A [Desulfosporosinus metallidurans]
MSQYRVSADIGGTFTDFVFYDSSTGKYKAGKTLTTPKNLSDAIIKGITEELGDCSKIDFFVHGTTSGLNAFLQRRGAKVAIITTKGFKDVYEIGRGNRTEMYSMYFRKPKPLVERKDVFEVNERVLFDGTVEVSLDKDNVVRVAEEIKKRGFDSIAVCLINAYSNPEHEVEIRDILEKALPGKSISLSHKIAREWREYERTSTVVLNAYIAPNVAKYLEVLEDRMKSQGFKESVYIMQSGGGVITAEIAKESPIQSLLSGPVGGAIGNKSLSETLGYMNLIGVDMGGTSYDVSMVVDGKPDVSTETDLEGFPILTPMVNIYTIGAGGGSIAWIEGGGLRVGPISAGSDPGPACYGNGGQEPTITDANVVLGRVDPEGFLGGNMVLDKEAAMKAVKKIADALNLSVEEAAEGICNIADAKMADAIRQITVRKGIDPRQFVLVAFGGAGPMHACLTAEELDINTILVPEMPGTFSAWGMHQSDIRQDAVRTHKNNVEDLSAEAMNDIFAEMTEEVSAILYQQNIGADKTEYRRSVDLRYMGQDHTLNVLFDEAILSQDSLKKMRTDFDQLHESVYGHHSSGDSVEVVNVRLTGLGKLERVPKEKTEIMEYTAPKPKKISRVIFYKQAWDTGIYDRTTLKPGQKFFGPAIIEELTTTTVVPPKYEITVDGFFNLLIKKIGGI